ncbi:MAG: hypothetical protein JNJ82_05815 [Opitutaceae bacterium]|nr:hypothetical protein [Opitutaceae bacterium]
MSPSDLKELAGFPAPLRALVEAELQAGNTVVELGHGFPAAPCGAYLKLGRRVTTRPRESAGELDFYERNMPGYSGEFTHAARHFFVLEPPHPPEPPPDMDAIRAGLSRGSRPAAKPAAAPESAHRKIPRNETLGPPRKRAPEPAPAPNPAPARASARKTSAVQTTDADRVERFRASMALDYDAWKEGTGYDLSLLRGASPADRAAIEALLLARTPPENWRDIEALAALDTPRAREVLQAALADPHPAVRLAVHRFAPELLSEQRRTESLVQALATAETFGGLTETLAEVEQFHPPPVITALLRGLVERDGPTAVHLAAMLYYLHGKADSPFDWSHRPFFLRFHTTDPAEREQAARDLCSALAIDLRRCFPPEPAT